MEEEMTDSNRLGNPLAGAVWHEREGSAASVWFQGSIAPIVWLGHCQITLTFLDQPDNTHLHSTPILGTTISYTPDVGDNQILTVTSSIVVESVPRYYGLLF